MTGTTDPRRVLADRVRAALPPGVAVREVAMFGGLSLMVDGALRLSAGPDGSLLVRVAPARSAELLARPGARPAEMGAGRSMGPGWLIVDADALASEQALADWVQVALDPDARA